MLKKTKRLTLRRFREDDWGDLYDMLSDEETVKYDRESRISSFDGARMEAERRARDDLCVAVCLGSEGGKVIGSLVYSLDMDECSEIGCTINREYWHKGYAREAVEALIEYIFCVEGMYRIEAWCDTRNERAWGLLESIGFVREGMLRKNLCRERDERGEWMRADSYAYGLLRDEWE